VFMGMGEPLANYKAVLGAVRRLTEPAPAGLGLSARGVTGLDGRAGAGDRAAGQRRGCRSRWRCRCTPRRRAPRRAGADQHPVHGRRRPWTPPAPTRPPGAGSAIEYALIRDMNDHAWRADLLARELNRRGKGWVHVEPDPPETRTPGSKWTARDPRSVRRSSSGGCARPASHTVSRHAWPRDRRRLRAVGGGCT
jgi:23S rRNA (adenine2503-C2)-methyltransferase